MDKKLLIINVMLTLTDTIICALALGALFFASLRFGYWWINLFSFVPLALYFQRGIILEVQQEEQQNGDDNAE